MIMLYLFDTAFQPDAGAHNWVLLQWRILCLLLRLPERPNRAHVARHLHKDRLQAGPWCVHLQRGLQLTLHGFEAGDRERDESATRLMRMNAA